MKAIWKFPLEVTYTQDILVPKGSDFLTVQVQKGIPCLWVLCNPEETIRDTLKVFIFGTGHPIFDNASIGSYVATFQLDDGEFMGHVFIM